MLTHVARPFRHAIAYFGNYAPLDFGACRPCFRSVLAPARASAPISQAEHRHLPHLKRHSRQLFSLRTLALSTPSHRRPLISEGRTTTVKGEDQQSKLESKSPFYLETGYSIFAKRPPRPFPPPFVSLPSGSFSDPLTTHNPVRGRRPSVNGQPVRGVTNGDDAIIIGDENFIAVNDGVGAWAQKERGHAALWSRLIAHFWAVEVEKSFQGGGNVKLEDLDPIRNLQDAYDQTKAATKARAETAPEPELDSGDDGNEAHNTEPLSQSRWPSAFSDSESSKDGKPGEGDILGTTTASSALLHYKPTTPDPTPIVLATTLGDCKVFVIRPSAAPPTSDADPDSAADDADFSPAIIYRSKEQWHWFDCPRQLGTNSPDTPTTHAVTDTVEISLDDVICVVSDGVTDNLWEHEIAATVTSCVRKWESGTDEAKDGVVYVARTLMNAARLIAQDPDAESPYMERAFDEGIAAQGGKLDDISVVIGICRKRAM